MARTILHLGTNQGFKEINLELARLLISNFVGPIVQQSGLYRTEAWGITDQEDFYNQALICDTSLAPMALLEEINKIEHKLGRKRKERWGPRIIDIDIIFYEANIIETAELQIPHPQFRNRKFVLAPLMEICPELIDPLSLQSVQEIAATCADPSKVESLE